MNWNLIFLKRSMTVVLLAAGAFTGTARAADAAAGRDFTDFQLITERNIFDPNRRPRIRSETARPRQVVDSFSLAGTMSYPKGLFAFFDGNSGEYRKVVEKGDKIAGYTVGQIDHDLVKLVQDTNEVALKVGMQMRRSEDGKWFPAEGSAGGNSYASGSRSGSGRSERRSWGNGNNNGGDRSRTNSRQYNNNSEQSSPGGGAISVPMPMAVEGAPVPPEAAGLDPNDPVARLMLRRMQETGGATPGNGDPGNSGDSGNPNESGNPGGGAPNGSNPNDNPVENPNQGGN